MLSLQNEYDPVTPLAGAEAAFEATPNSHMILIDDEIQHTAFPYGTDCVDFTVTQYLLDGTLPKVRRSTCPALPLFGEKKRYSIGSLNNSEAAVQPRQMPASSFKGPGNEAVNRIAQITQSQPGFGLLFGPGWHHNQSRLVR
jgi:hypothetical protein